MNMKKTTLGKTLFALIFFGLLAVEVYAVVKIIQLNMLPILYVILIVLLLSAFSAGIGMLLFRPGKGSGKVRKIVACVLTLLLLCGCVVIITVVSDVLGTLNATSKEATSESTREIYVLTENKAQDLQDTVGYTFGYVKSFDESCTQQVLEELASQFDTPLASAGYTNLFSMVNALLNDQIDAMIMNGGYVSILEETEGFLDFSSRARILAQIRVEEGDQSAPLLPEQSVQWNEPEVQQENVTEPVQTEPAEEKTDYTKLKPFIVYVSGSDGHSTMLKSGRSDVNILAAVNPMTKQVLLINTPRDYYVRNTAGGGSRDKLTHCGLYGVSCSMNTLGNLYDETVEYYVQINFTGFKKLIDALGGITVYSDYAFTAITRTYISKGENNLTGQQALDFARERYTLPGGDNERGRHQMQVIEAVIKKATSGTTIISNYSDIMESIEGMFTMNIPADMIGDLMKMQLSDMAQWNIVTYSATGTAAMAECYSLPGMNLSVIKPSDSSVSKAARLIDMVFAGELLTEEIINSMT